MLSTAWLHAIAPVGVLGADNCWSALGTCVLLRMPKMLWMVTANHVLEKVGKQSLTVLVTHSSGDGVVVVEVGKILADHKLPCVQDAVTDLAAAPMPSLPEWGFTAVTSERCLPLAELVPSMPCFTVGCPYGLHGVNRQRAMPLVLDGIISGLDQANHRIYTSAPTFPGNSGGPLIAVRSQFDAEGGLVAGRPTVFLAGIMLETKLLHAPDPSSRMPSLHLGVAAPTDAVLALLDSDQAQAISAQVETLRSASKSAVG
jgi:hypothetical protein